MSLMSLFPAAVVPQMQQQQQLADLGVRSAQASVGASQRFTSHLQLHLSTVTVLLAAAWAVLLHAAQCACAAISSGLANQTAAARSHLVLLRRSSPSRFYRTAPKALGPPPPSSQHSAPAPSSTLVRRHLGTQQQEGCAFRDATGQQQEGGAFRDATGQQQQHYAHVPEGTATHRAHSSRRPASGVLLPAAASIPKQLLEHRGRLTVALDLDETLLCTYRLEHRHGRQGDALQLVPANRPGAACTGSPSSSGGGGISSSWSSLLRKSSSTGGSSSAGSPGSGLGHYSISRHADAGLPGELGAAARASAWMHYTPPPRPAHARASSSSPGGSPPQLTPGPHSLAVFLRPGCFEFLCQLACFAEVVLFTAAAPEYGAPLAELLDPSGRVFRGRLYADACSSHAGRRGVKDLQVLGRDVRRVVLVDNCLFSFLAQPRNGLPCLPYHGAAGDSQLLAVILPLLRSLSQVGGDIRPLLDSMFHVRQWLASKGYSTRDDAADTLAAD